MKQLILFVALLSLGACKEELSASVPDPVELSGDALGYFCQMNLAEHEGPKGQIHLSGFPAPLFFSQVRDVVAFLREPEQVAPIRAVYVSDMSVAANWADPGASNWIDASSAIYVVGSDAIGGMGAPEIVSFGVENDALAFAAQHGGAVMRLEDIPTDAVLGAVDRDISQLALEDQ